MNAVSIPTPPKLDHAPELAVLAALDAALRASVFAMISAHPPLRDPDCNVGQDSPDDYWVALAFVSLAEELGDALSAYQRSIERGRGRKAGRQAEFPF